MSKSTNISKIETRAKKIVRRSKYNIMYFGQNEGHLMFNVDDHITELIYNVRKTYKDISSIYNQNSVLSPRNKVLISIIINMFNYNFWSENKTLPNSTVLLETIYNEFNSNKDLDLFYGGPNKRFLFIKKLKKAIKSQNFKCKKIYLDDISKLANILSSKRKRLELYLYISGVIQGEISIQKHIKILGKIWPSYGKDSFFKREILAWYFIKDSIPTLLKKIPNEELYFPIDYRLPSILNHIGFMQFPKRFEKYFDGSKILKNKKDEKLIRAVSFLVLINLNRWLNLDARKLDYYFFSKSRTLLKSKHLKVETTNY